MSARILFYLTIAVTVTGQHLDQHTDESASFRNIPMGRMWQTWQAGWSSELTHIDVLMGSRYPCESMNGKLLIKQGQPTDMANAIDEASALLVQDVVTECDSTSLASECENNDCVSWHRFALNTPVPLQEGQTYSFVLSDMVSADLTRTARVGVSPAADNQGGVSSLLISPKYKTKYAQYTFRTHMATTKDAAGTFQNRGESSSEEGSGAVLGVVIPVVVAMLLIIIAIIVVKKRRSKNVYAFDGSEGSSEITMTDLDSRSIMSHISATTTAPVDNRSLYSSRSMVSHRPRHAIHVQSADHEDYNSSNTWADNVSFQTTQFYQDSSSGSDVSFMTPPSQRKSKRSQTITPYTHEIDV